MGILFIDQGELRTFELNGEPMSIGRDAKNDIVVVHPTVSRAHASIGGRPGQYVITDHNSRNGTRVNGRSVKQTEVLVDGARLRIGHVRAWYFEQMPARVPRSVSNRDAGVIFDCNCGQRLWSATDTVGMAVVCGSCNKNVEVPDASRSTREDVLGGTVAGVMLAAASGVQDTRSTCGVCQWPIEKSERAFVCAACHTHFHLDCWKENQGCATYGCAQVNALKPKQRPAAPVIATPDVVIAPTIAPVAIKSAPQTEQMTQTGTWPFMLLALSVVGSLLGLLAFGVPAGVVALVALVRLLTTRTENRAVLTAAVVIAALGTGAGLMISRLWWLNIPLI